MVCSLSRNLAIPNMSNDIFSHFFLQKVDPILHAVCDTILRLREVSCGRFVVVQVAMPQHTDDLGVPRIVLKLLSKAV